MCGESNARQVRQSPQKRRMHDIEYRAHSHPVDPSQSPSQEWRLGGQTCCLACTFAFLASAAGTRDLQDKILAKDHPLKNTAVDLVLACWMSDTIQPVLKVLML